MIKDSNIVQPTNSAIPNLRTERVEEFELKPKDSLKIQQLLAQCFPDYPTGATYYKQLPGFRYLTFDGSKLIGHIGVDLRMINNDNQLVRALCISDVCVDEAYRDRQIASALLKQLETDAAKKEIDFLILIANESKVYYHHGYRSRENLFRWLLVQNDKCLGVVQRNLGKNTVMVKRLGEQVWSNGLTDLLGPIF